MRHWKLLALLAVLQLLLISTTAFAQDQTIRVVYYPPWNVSKLPLYLASEARIFEKNGLKVSLTNPGSNRNLLTAMKNNDADIFVASSNHIVQNKATGGGELVIVANTGYNYSIFLVHPSITKPEDLKGKKVGTGELGHTPDRLTRLALGRLGLNPEKDVTLVPYRSGGSMERAVGLISGEVSAAMISSDAIFELEKSGEMAKFRALTDHKKLNIYAGGGGDYAISATFLKQSRDKAKIFVRSICEGIALARKDKARAVEIIGKTVRKSDPAVIDFLYRIYVGEVIPERPYPRLAAVDLGILMMSSVHANTEGMKSQDFIDSTLISELEKEGLFNRLVQ